jgi:hypothetical protein
MVKHAIVLNKGSRIKLCNRRVKQKKLIKCPTESMRVLLKKKSRIPGERLIANVMQEINSKKV